MTKAYDEKWALCAHEAGAQEWSGLVLEIMKKIFNRGRDSSGKLITFSLQRICLKKVSEIGRR
jgi:hypothetical protein